MSSSAQKYLKEAVRLDPKFALGWALLSYENASATSRVLATYRGSARRNAAGCRSALSLQPDLGEAVLAKGFYYYACLKDYDTAERYLDQARQPAE